MYVCIYIYIVVCSLSFAGRLHAGAQQQKKKRVSRTRDRPTGDRSPADLAAKAYEFKHVVFLGVRGGTQHININLFLKISFFEKIAAIFGEFFRASQGPGVTGNGFSARNDSQFRGRQSATCDLCGDMPRQNSQNMPLYGKTHHI